MIQMVRDIRKPIHIPVDEWGTDMYPMEECDRIFKHVKGQLILPLSEMFCDGSEDSKQLDYFVMSNKRSYNSDKMRDHICLYLNYFEKYYDLDKELLMIYKEVKQHMDYNSSYSEDNFVNDIKRFIIRNDSLLSKIKRFVDDNYLMHLSSGNTKTPNLQYENRHAKVLYEVSLLTNMYIPLASHFMYINLIKVGSDIKEFMVKLFDECCIRYEEDYGIYIYDKLYETSNHVVDKSKNPDKPLWDKNAIRGVNTTTHTGDSVMDVILQIIPKYSYSNNIVNFNYFSNRQGVKLKITDVSYEYPFIKLSSSKRDEENNSEIDRFESNLSKKDESLLLANKVIGSDAINRIATIHGPYTDEEINFYKAKLTKDGKVVKNGFQNKLVGYLFFKDFIDPVSSYSINQTEYIKLIITAKRILLDSRMVILPYIISSRVLRVATRKNITSKELMRLQSDELWQQIVLKYKNPKIEKKILDIIGQILSSSFEIIDYNANEHRPGDLDGIPVPIVNDILNKELLQFVLNI